MTPFPIRQMTVKELEVKGTSRFSSSNAKLKVVQASSSTP